MDDPSVSDMNRISGDIENIGETLTTISWESDFSRSRRKMLIRRLKTEITSLQEIVAELERQP